MLEARPAQLSSALDYCGRVVALLAEPHWRQPTPCAGWAVRDLLNHVVATTTKFSEFAAGLTDEPRTPCGEVLGSSPVTAYDAADARSRSAWSQADLSRSCRLPFGTFTAGQAAAVNMFDLLVHAWDLACAAGVELPPPATDLVVVAAATAETLVTAESIAAGVYAQAGVQAPVDSSWTAVLVGTGRVPAPGWTFAQ